MTDWKPGDVAMVKCVGEEEEIGLCYQGGSADGAYKDRARWQLASDQVWSSVDRIRPLVVIDPEDFDRILALTNAMYLHGPGQIITETAKKVQAALREFAHPTPPKCDDEFRVGGSRGIHCELDADHTEWHRSNSSEVAWS